MGASWKVVLVLVACAGLAGAASANTNTVGPTGTAAVDYHSIQAALDALDDVNPATDTDPLPYHTILVQAGTYDNGDEESFYTHAISGDGLGATAGETKSLIVINDVTEKSGNSYLNDVHLVGVGVGQTVIDAEKAASNGRVVFIKNRNVWIEGITLKGGHFAAGAFKYWDGAGLLTHGSGLRLRNVKVLDCDITSGDRAYECVDIGGTRDSANGPMNAVLEGVEVTGFSGAGEALYVADATNVVLAHCHVHDNTSGGINLDGVDNSTIYGCLVSRNARIGIQMGNDSDSDYVANCTVVSNGGNGYYTAAYADGDRILNSVFTGHTNGFGIADPARTVAILESNIPDAMPESGFSTNGYGTVTPLTGTNPLEPANLDGDNAATLNSPGYDSGRTATGGACTYVDIDNDGVYDEGFDIVVGGTPPPDPDNDDRVYMTDIAGNPRVSSVAIDMGALEFVPVGTVIETQ